MTAIAEVPPADTTGGWVVGVVVVDAGGWVVEVVDGGGWVVVADGGGWVVVVGTGPMAVVGPIGRAVVDGVEVVADAASTLVVGVVPDRDGLNRRATAPTPIAPTTPPIQRSTWRRPGCGVPGLGRCVMSTTVDLQHTDAG